MSMEHQNHATPRAVSMQTIGEMWSSIVAQPVASIVTVLMILAMVLTVMLTTGRTVGAEQKVLGSIDSAGTRTIIVRAEDDAHLTAEVLNRLQRIEGIEWSVAFSTAVDTTNTRIPDGTRVAVRKAYGNQLGEFGIPDGADGSRQVAYASASALQMLGMPDASGSITTTTGLEYDVVGQLQVPGFLQVFEPLVVIPRPNVSDGATVNVLVVIARRPDLVAPITMAVRSLLAVEDPSKVTIQTSESLAQLRGLVQAQLATFSRGLVLVILGITGSIVAVVLYGLVMMRRKDFGRRRALGATRGFVVTLLLMQTTTLAVIGAALGCGASIAVLVASGDPLPGPVFTGALIILGAVTALVAGVLPAIVASRREPVRELRVP